MANPNAAGRQRPRFIWPGQRCRRRSPSRCGEDARLFRRHHSPLHSKQTVYDRCYRFRSRLAYWKVTPPVIGVLVKFRRCCTGCSCLRSSDALSQRCATGKAQTKVHVCPLTVFPLGRKGNSAIRLTRLYGERKRNFVGQHFWARGYSSPQWAEMKHQSRSTSEARNRRTCAWIK